MPEPIEDAAITCLRFQFIGVIEDLKNQPYKWGGDDPLQGFDCSGMVIEGLKSVGLIGESDDYSANGLLLYFRDDNQSPMMDDPYMGCLIFFLNSTLKAIHIGVALDSDFMIHAGGGGRPRFSLYEAIHYSPFLLEFYSSYSPDDLKDLLQRDIFLQMINQQLYLQQAARQNAYIKTRQIKSYCKFREKAYGNTTVFLDPFIKTD